MPNQYVNKIVKSDGTVLIDLSGDTVTSAAHIMSGYIGHLADGSQVTGTGSDGDPDDYTSASTALGISKPITSGIEALTTYANGVTGESDTNLSDAVYSLAQGYGSGGDYVAADFADKTKPTGAVTFLQSSFPANTAYFAGRTGITKLYAPNFTTTGNLGNLFREMTALQYAIFPKCERFYNTCFYGCTNLVAIDCKGGTTGSSIVFSSCLKLKTIILRKSDGIAALNSGNAFNNTPFASGKSGGTIYIPKALYDHLGDGGALDYKAATNWSTIDGYGTITWAQIEGSYYETHYADGTEIPTA